MLPTLDPNHLFSIDDYPPIEYPPALAVEIRHNWWGHTQLHIQEGKERIKHLDAITIGAQIEKGKIQECILKLEAEKETLDHANNIFLNMLKECDEVRRKECEKLKRIEEL